MKLVGAILGIVVLIAVGLGIYKATTMFNFEQNISQNTMKKSIENKLEQAKKDAENGLQSGKQYMVSGAQHLILSGQALIDAKKKEAEIYLLQQKEQLKQDAQKVLEAEAKKRIDALFTGK